MTHTICHVVGDRFGAFAKNPNVVTISDLLTALSRGEARHEDTRFVAGQGLQEELVHALLSTAERAGLLHLFSVWSKPPPADGRLSHKVDSRNTMITQPVLAGDDLYEAEFSCDERVDVLSDHITGQHLPGLLLIEAARQLNMAVYDEYFNPTGQKSSFVVTVLNNAFTHYVFPIGARMKLRILEKTDEGKGRFSLHTLTDAIQAGKSTFQQEARFTAFPHAVILGVEGKRAQQALAAAQAEPHEPARHAV